MKRLLILAALLFCSPSLAQQATYVYTPLGYQQITAVPTGTILTVPTGARMAQICVSTQAVRYRDDGTAPTATVGYPVAAATCFTYSGSLPAITFIQQTGTAVLDILYYR
jgi:hypothetical protein